MKLQTKGLMLIGLMLIFGASAGARDMQKISKDIPADPDIKTISLRLDIDIAELTLTTHAGGDILRSEGRYNADKINAVIDYEKLHDEGDITVKVEQVRKKYNLDSEDCRLRISLSTDYVWKIDFEAGFADCKLDLSGLPLEKIRLDLGASECRLSFEEPNPVQLGRFTVDAGAGEVHLLGLGYANFDNFSFDGGAGEFVLNFEGFTDKYHEAEIDVGIGEITVELPGDFPVRLRTDNGWLSSIEIQGDDMEMDRDGLFSADDFDEGDFGLDVDFDIGIGEATITLVD